MNGLKTQSTTYKTEPHCCTKLDGTLKLSIHDGGGGHYLVVNASEWALGNNKEIDQFSKMMKDQLKEGAA